MGINTVVGLLFVAFTQSSFGLLKGLTSSGKRFVPFPRHRQFIFSSSVFSKRRRTFATKPRAFRTVIHALPSLQL
jgi:hypothetical protein